MYKYEKLQQAVDKGLIDRNSLSIFIHNHKASALGNALADCGIIQWEAPVEEYEGAREWWESERSVVINWDQIIKICDAYSNDPPPKWRNFGYAKRAKLQEYFGIVPTKRPRMKRLRCDHCGQ